MAAPPSASNTTVPSGSASANPFAALPAIPPLDDTFGALLIGTFVGLIQYGWTTHQCYRYFRMYPEDTWLLKSLVAGVLLLETFHSVLCMHICYFYLTTNYFNPLALQSGVWSISLLGVVTGAVIFLSQLFFLRRVYLIGKKFRPLVFLCALFLLTELGLATSVTVDTFIHPTLHNSDQAWMNSAGVGIAALSDTLVTAALTFSLHRSRTGIKRTDSLIDVLIMYAINTGLVTGIANILSFCFAIAMPNNLIYAGIDIVATKFYANSLMAVLNSRRALAQSTSGLVTSSSMNMSVLPRNRGTRGTLNRGHRSSPPIDIMVTKETVGGDVSSHSLARYEDHKEEMLGPSDIR
ncbi:hypothetical protein BD309DRAFT_1021046 [Dichomitus squalens]|uniref:Uncharacterized protein n=1 Tax=Dichomitus squalens TaxID=114155 RepID=A0A4Q9NKC1_9APHY|nr:hypothetical protein BD309DRAFT_1021046 [Dichomitus squalens]TBU53269.1 hypothetical protein BD310DRAFT_981219 [Dichomitus squalens]